MSLANLVMFNDQRLSDAQVTDLLQDAPLMRAIQAVAASNGTNHRYKKETTASSAAFRAIDAGLLKTKSASTQVDITLKILDGSFAVDVAEANAYRGGRNAYLDLELMKALRQAMFIAERQIIYGAASPGDTGGFSGLRDNAQLDALADAMVYNAGGTTASTQTSVYLLRSTPDDVAYVAGNDGNISFNTEDVSVIEKYEDPTVDSKSFPAFYVPVTGYAGFQIGSAYSAARICNIHPSDSNAQLNDDKLYEALALFPASRMPNLIVMNRKAVKMLRDSRTATNVTGAPAPIPVELEGIPIIVTDAIVSTEAVEV